MAKQRFSNIALEDEDKQEALKTDEQLNEENLDPEAEDQVQTEEVDTQVNKDNERVANALSDSPFALNQLEKKTAVEDDEFLPDSDSDIDAPEPDSSATPDLDEAVDEAEKSTSTDPEDLADIVTYQEQQKIDAQETDEDTDNADTEDSENTEESGDAESDQEEADDAPADETAEDSEDKDSEDTDDEDAQDDAEQPEDSKADEPAAEGLVAFIAQRCDEIEMPRGVSRALTELASCESALDQIIRVNQIGRQLTRQAKPDALAAALRLQRIHAIAQGIGVTVKLKDGFAMESLSRDSRYNTHQQSCEALVYSDEGVKEVIKAIVDRIKALWDKVAQWARNFWSDAGLDITDAISAAEGTLAKVMKGYGAGGSPLQDRFEKLNKKPWTRTSLSAIGKKDEQLDCAMVYDRFSKAVTRISVIQASLQSISKKLQSNAANDRIEAVTAPMVKGFDPGKPDPEDKTKTLFESKGYPGGVYFKMHGPTKAFDINTMEKNEANQQLLKAQDWDIAVKKEPVTAGAVNITGDPVEVKKVLDLARKFNGINMVLKKEQINSIDTYTRQLAASLTKLQSQTVETLDVPKITASTYALGLSKNLIQQGLREVAKARRRFAVSLLKYSTDTLAHMLVIIKDANEEVITKVKPTE